MFEGLFDAGTKIIGNCTTIAVAPVVMSAEIVTAVTKPIADTAKDAIDDLRELFEE